MSGLASVETVPWEDPTSRQENPARIVRVVGEIDLSNARDVMDAVAAALPHDRARVVLDLSPTAYVDSAGIAGLFRLAERVQQRRQRLHLVVPGHSPIRKVIELTGLDQVVPVFESLEAVEEPGP